MSGEQHFINNTAVDGGALHLLSFAQLRLLPGLNILFQGNSGRYVHSI